MQTARSALVAIVCCLAAWSAVSRAQPPLPPPPAGVQVTREFGLEFVTVTAAGNAGFAPAPGAEWPAPGALGNNVGIGRVDYDYRIARTELTTGQWFEFVQAYAPFYTGPRNDPNFTSRWIRPDNQGGYAMGLGYENLPAEVGWDYAARYCNWLHNGRVNEAWAFESGVYDASTFGYNGLYFTHNTTPAPGARVRLPTLDEWYKAVYFDPNRNGPGQPGHWTYPNASDTPLVPGLPWEGGQTMVDVETNGTFPLIDVGSYGWVQTPWGLLDASGGVREWSTTAGPGNFAIVQMGTSNFHIAAFYVDRIDREIYSSSPSGWGGVRLVTNIPGPSTFVVGAAVAVGLFSRRRR